MNKKLNQLKIAIFPVFAVLFLAVGISAQRDRVVEKPTPTPSISPTPVSTPVPVQTLPFLQSKIRFTLQKPELRRGNIGVKIVSLDTGKTVFEQNSDKYFMPASNMKVFTVAAAIEKLSPNFQFVTSVYAPAMPDENGVIKGDLTIYGRGDISFSTAFSEGDYYKGLDNLVEKIAQSGVKKIEGNLIGDESYFRGDSLPGSWEWDDLQWYYGAGISALSLNDNAVDLRILPGSNGASCIAQVLPNNNIVRIINKCTTSGTKRNLQVTKKLDQNIIEISGTMPFNDSGYTGYIAVSRPADLFIALLRQRLEQKGITITGQNRTFNNANFSSANKIEIAKLESTQLSIIAQKTLKPSQNLYTETLLWTLGEQLGDKTNLNATSAEKGLDVVKKFLQGIGVAPDGIVQYDGSGLSRHNLVTPEAVVQVYQYMAKSPYSIAWNAALTIGGVDGTLKNRFKGTSAEANVRGKTGTIDQVSSLSGYLTSTSGEKFVFSIIVNGVNPTSLRTKTIDEIVIALSDFNGKSEL
jgi:D-alanyl-D-alanine carboxypeptidase/D-alanyl-D-alanine-endopeptidase (penicillin-binding protein 4)